MLLYNQTKNPLRWKISMTTYTCDAWGSVEIPDMFVMHCKTRGLPLDVSPVAPEVRANVGLADATSKANSDELVILRNEVELARSSEKSAKSELEKVKTSLSDAQSDATKLQVSVAEQKRVNGEQKAELQAAEKLLEETAKKLVESTKAVERLEATIAELKKNKPTK